MWMYCETRHTVVFRWEDWGSRDALNETLSNTLKYKYGGVGSRTLRFKIGFARVIKVLPNCAQKKKDGLK